MSKNFKEVLLARFKTELEAEMAFEFLKSHGIFSFIKKDDPTTMGLNRGATIYVRKEDKKEALKTLELHKS
jgi:hypothetical protein